MRVLSSRDVCRIVGLIEDFYRYDCRNTLTYLEKWMVRAGVSRDTIEKVFLILDGGKCAGGEKNLCGLREILEKYYGEPRALAIMQELTDALGVSSPFPCDPVFEVLDHERRLYALGDPKERVVARAVRKRGDLVLKDVVVAAFPVRFTKYESSDGSRPPMYEVVLETVAGHVVAVGPAAFQEVLERLKWMGLVERPRLVHGVFAAVLQALIGSGRGEVREV
ncbi:MAG: hypothetical protein QXJ97_03230 [Desulfurococcaceae archaeon]